MNRTVTDHHDGGGDVDLPLDEAVHVMGLDRPGALDSETMERYIPLAREAKLLAPAVFAVPVGWRGPAPALSGLF
ncbi:MAG TPA: hypothetical protein VFS39_01530 [Nitrospira sp.]|nr:hypothetical protein [Nitrospira sp.]